MRLSTKILRNQIKLLKPIITGCSIETARAAQDKLGKLMMGSPEEGSGALSHFLFFL